VLLGYEKNTSVDGLPVMSVVESPQGQPADFLWN
jgi:hypothetical protein